jgi:hypothetical protein
MPSGAERAVLMGETMVPLIRAVAALTETELGRWAVVGGVAVTARLGRAHRATADVDAVVAETERTPDALQLLLSRTDTEVDPAGTNRVLVAGTAVELLRVGTVRSGDLDGVPESDALFVAAHCWALETAQPLTVSCIADPTTEVTAPFATPAALVAMKLHAALDRAPAATHKRASDVWDIYRILVDLDVTGGVRHALAGSPPDLRRLVANAARRVLVDDARRTRSWLSQGDEVMRSVTADELRYLGGPLLDALAGGGPG